MIAFAVVILILIVCVCGVVLRKVDQHIQIQKQIHKELTSVQLSNEEQSKNEERRTSSSSAAHLSRRTSKSSSAAHHHQESLPPDAESGFVAFLSHFKIEAATEARWLKRELEERLGARCFLDSDDLLDLSKLRDHVRESKCVLLLQTRSVLT